MVIAVFTTRSREDLDKLAHDIAAALHKRLRDLQAATTEHAQLLNTSLDDTGAALKLVNTHLASPLYRPPSVTAGPDGTAKR